MSAAEGATVPILPLSRVRGHERSCEALARSVAAGRLHPSLIFHGPEGVGKRTAALALAAGLVCERPDGVDACGRCHACRRAARAADATELRKENERRDSPIQYPDVGHVDFIGPTRRRILVSQVRDVIHSLEQHPLELSRRVYVIDHAESLSLEAQNALLKTLEEPPGDGVVILLAASLASLLPTTRSRCQAFPFAPLDEASLQGLLTERGMSPEEAGARAALAEGRVGRALDLDLGELRATRDAVLDALEAVVAEARPAAAAVSRAAALVRDQHDLAQVLELLGEMARDLMVLQAGGSGSLIHREVSDRLHRLAPGVDGASAAERLEALRRDAITFNLNPRMTLEGALLAFGGNR